MKKLLILCLLAPFAVLAQGQEPDKIQATATGPDASEQKQVFIEPNYVYDAGITYDEEGEAITLKEAFTQIYIEEDTMYLTVFYNPTNLFRKKATEEYVIATSFYYTDDGAVSAKGNRLSVVYDEDGNPQLKQESYKFVFFLEESQLVIESLVDSEIKFILTGQQLPAASELPGLQEQVEKTQARK